MSQVEKTIPWDWEDCTWCSCKMRHEDTCIPEKLKQIHVERHLRFPPPSRPSVMNKIWLSQAISYHRKKNVQGPLWNYIRDVGMLKELEFILPLVLVDYKYGVLHY